MADSFSVEITKVELKDLLKKVLLTPHKDIISEIIIGNLDTTAVGMVQLYKALNGIDNKIPWKVGMSCLIKEDSVYTSKDKEAMTKAGMIHQGYMKGFITKIDPYAYSSIKVEYDIINRSGSKLKGSYDIHENSVKEDEQWPDTLIVTRQEEDSLPF